ncbi:hypothetical protein DPQ22_06815, partial [Candidatus Tokpelaia sp.]
RASDFAFDGSPDCFNFLPFNSKSFLLFGNRYNGTLTTMAQEGFFSEDYRWTATAEPYPLDYGNSVSGASLGRVGNGWVLHSSNFNQDFTPSMVPHWRTSIARQLQVVDNRLTIDVPADTGAGVLPNYRQYLDLTLQGDDSLPIREMTWGAIFELFIDAPAATGTELSLSAGGVAALRFTRTDSGFTLDAADFGTHPVSNITDYNRQNTLPVAASR